MSTYEGKSVKEKAGLLREGRSYLITSLRKFGLHTSGHRKPQKALNSMHGPAHCTEARTKGLQGHSSSRSHWRQEILAHSD